MFGDSFNMSKHGYVINNETRSYVYQQRLFEEHPDRIEMTEKEFWFSVERLDKYEKFLKTGNMKVSSYARYIAKQLKKKVKIEPVIRYMSNVGLITFVDEETITIHLE